MAFSIYSESSKRIVRIITSITILILILSSFFHCINTEINTEVILILAQNSIVILLALFLLIFPTKLFLISLISYQYSIVSLIFDSRDIMGILMFVLGTLVLDFRGFFSKHKKTKITIIISIFVCLHLTEIRFGLSNFLSATIYKTGYIFVLSLIVLIFIFRERNRKNDELKNLNLAIYPTLKKRDAEWLIHIQNNQKYDWIAIEYNMSAGSVKNRLKLIFNTLEVGDKTGFMNKYSDYKITYDESEEK